MIKFESSEYKDNLNAILNQISSLNKVYYECMHEWEQRLKSFIDEFPTEYYKINDKIYVQKKEFSSGVVKQGGEHTVKLPISWARFEGIVVYNGKGTINESFATSIRIKPGDTVEPIDENTFIEVFGPVCNRVFADTEENFRLQYDNFPFGFYRTLEDYAEIFPETAHKFNAKLEMMFDKDNEE